jgi:PKD repeat protein
LTASNTAGSDSNTKTNYITVSGSNGFGNIIEDLVSFYPNPVSNILNIKCGKDFSVRLYDMLGKKLVDVQNKHQIDISSIESGIYLIQIELEGSIFSNKIVKK